ncbi:oxidoreductase, partial [Streptomyces sp. NPDC041003]
MGCVGAPRLLAGLDQAPRLDRVAHLTTHGSLPRYRPEELVDLADNIDLRGRGGAGFPFSRKLRAVMRSARGREGQTAVVVNGSEGEPSCLKDTALLLHAPHLVLDGALLAAAAISAEDVVVGVTRTDVEQSVRAAVAERGPAGRRVRVALLPERFVTGEGTAHINGLNGGETLPSGQKVRTSERGLNGVPTLLSNTETFAQLAVAARLGALDYRTAGLPAEPGTVLLTVAGSTVVETPTGAALSYILELCGTGPGQGVLVGGYHGKWLDPGSARAAEPWAGGSRTSRGSAAARACCGWSRIWPGWC